MTERSRAEGSERAYIVAASIGLLLASVTACGSASKADPNGSTGGTDTVGGAFGDGISGSGGTSGTGSTAVPPTRCGAHSGFGTTLHFQTVGPSGDAYDGPALVERSTSDQLILYFTPLLAPGDTSTTPAHLKISGLDPMPILPRGAKLWLSKNPAGEPIAGFGYFSAEPWAITVRTAKDGKILFGSAMNAFDTRYAPLAIGAVIPICSDPNPDCRADSTAQVIYSQVTVLADTPQPISDGAERTVQIGGSDYSVRVSAQGFTGTNCGLSDYYPYAIGGEAVDVQAKDMQSLIAGLELGELPDSVQGSAPSSGDNWLSLASRSGRDWLTVAALGEKPLAIAPLQPWPASCRTRA